MSEVLLLFDGETTEVEAWLGRFTGGLEWGGVLRSLPAHIAAAVRQSSDVRIRLVYSGQERRIHPLRTPSHGDTNSDVLFLGTHTAPF
ncbi:hypothetical protein [Streptomyces sp. NPDC058739]|uniref:hypothetical protein n=1 Tax=Streptomyces sp. NPDC058739 TaxID=3346618 RepID=UPI0036C57DB9